MTVFKLLHLWNSWEATGEGKKKGCVEEKIFGVLQYVKQEEKIYI